MELSVGCCCSSVVLLEMLVVIGFVGVSCAASSAAVTVDVQSLCRDMGDTWRGGGSEKGLGVAVFIGRTGAHGGELFRVSWGVGVLGRVS